MLAFVNTPFTKKHWIIWLTLSASLLPVIAQAELRAALSAQVIDELTRCSLSCETWARAKAKPLTCQL